MLDVILESPLEEVVTLEVITRLYALGVIAPLASREREGAATSAPSFFEVSTREPAPVERTLSGDLEPLPQFDAQWLAPEVARQLEAFRIRPVVEPPEQRPLTPEMAAFTQGDAAAEDASLASALAQVPELIAEQDLVPETLASAPTAQPLHERLPATLPVALAPVAEPALEAAPAAIAPQEPEPVPAPVLVPLARIQLRSADQVPARIDPGGAANPEAEFFKDEPEVEAAPALAPLPEALPPVPVRGAEMAAEPKVLARVLVAATALALIAAAVAVTL